MALLDIKVYIQDTGCRNVADAEAGTPVVDANFLIANGGTVIPLNVESLTFSAGQGISAPTYIGGTKGSGASVEHYKRPEVQAASTTSAKWVAKGNFDLNQAADLLAIGYFDSLSSTKGVKRLLSEDDSDSRILIYHIRETAGDVYSAAIGGTTYRYVYVRVESINMTNSASHPFRVNWTMNMVETE